MRHSFVIETGCSEKHSKGILLISTVEMDIARLKISVPQLEYSYFVKLQLMNRFYLEIAYPRAFFQIGIE